MQQMNNSRGGVSRDPIVCLFVGIAIGWIVGRTAPSSVPIGRWIWVLPAFVVFPGMASEEFSSQLVPWLPEYFFATGSNEGLAVFFGMLPAFSALGYSIGMALFGTKTKRRNWRA